MDRRTASIDQGDGNPVASEPTLRAATGRARNAAPLGSRAALGTMVALVAMYGAVVTLAPRLLDADDFIRGDANGDGLVDWGDFARIALARVDERSSLRCDDAADVDDDGELFDTPTEFAADADMQALATWLFGQAPVPTTVPPLVAPFPRRGADPTRDGLDCARGFTGAPAGSRAGNRLGWDLPRQLDAGATNVSVFVEVDAIEPVIGFSLAYIYDSSAIAVRGVDSSGTALPRRDATRLADAGLLRWSTQRTLENGRRLLLIGALFLDAAWRPIELGGRAGGGAGAVAGSTRVARLVIDVLPTAPVGAPRAILVPFLGDYFAAEAQTAGGLRSQIHHFEALPFHVPLDPDQLDSAIPLLGGPGRIDFTRGDANADGAIDITDPVYTLGFLFLGGPPPPTDDAADANDDGVLDIADPTFSLGVLFLGSGTFPSPYPACGLDPTPDTLFCCYYPPCSD